MVESTTADFYKISYPNELFGINVPFKCENDMTYGKIVFKREVSAV